MSLARFVDRAADASVPLLEGLGRTSFLDRLSSVTVGLSIDTRLSRFPAARAAFLLAANLAARLYPRLVLSAPVDLERQATELIEAINPAIDLMSRGDVDAQWSWTTAPASGADVHVSATAWNVAVNASLPDDDPPEMPAALVAAAIGIGDVFRTVFSKELGDRGRVGLEPRAFDILTGGPPSFGGATLDEQPDLGRVYLAGAGAVGEAAALAFRETRATGTLVAVDPERIDVGNLQRYVLAFDRDERTPKPEIVERELLASGIAVEAVHTAWGADPRTQTPTETVLAALDTTQGRIELQAALPRRLFNAYTQPLDIGWSRHEEFGLTGCLACLYWPTSARPHRFEVLAAALHQDPRRVLRYATNPTLKIDQPIASSDLPAELDPDERRRWAETSIAVDIGSDLFGDPDALAMRGGSSIDDLYHEVCAGTLVPTQVGQLMREVIVPLAHQSALAGIMLATQILVANNPELAARRPAEQQMRMDVLRPQGPRPLMVGRVAGCICNDRQYLETHRARWMASDA